MCISKLMKKSLKCFVKGTTFLKFIVLEKNCKKNTQSYSDFASNEIVKLMLKRQKEKKVYVKRVKEKDTQVCEQSFLQDFYKETT